MMTISFILMIVCLLCFYTTAKGYKEVREEYESKRDYYLKNFVSNDEYKKATRRYNEVLLGSAFFLCLAIFFLTVIISIAL